MQWTSLNDIREMYLSFFETKGSLRQKSYPLVPIGDKSLLLINAGMAPLKKYFTGEEEPPCTRMTTCQKCIRTPDIERVGITARHGTYFEMLGNFSFGDYFKREAIHWAWEFMTGEQWLALPEKKLWATIYENDDEAFEIWNREVGVPAERIVRLGKADNFWEIGSGPCGPCSEIYFDRGPEYGCGSPDCKPGCDCDRFMEFWNLVFTQFDGDGEGNYTPLAKPNIDTGMGLERMACIMQGVNNLFEVDTVRNIMLAISDVAKVRYGASPKTDISLRVITDHIRSTTFLICDGVVPSNEGRGYVLRRLLRRAARHGRLLGIQGTFLSDICDVVARENLSAYPEVTERLEYIKKIVSIEEERFAATIDAGLAILEHIIADAKAAGRTELAGADIFRLSDTFGFSIDLTREIAAEQGLTLDTEGYNALMAEQKQRARAARAALGDFGWKDDVFAALSELDKTEFTGYDETESDAKVVAIIDSESGEAVGSLAEGNAMIILDRTPFYGEGGGQVGDTGTIASSGALLEVTDTKKHDGVYMHVAKVVSGRLSQGDEVTASIDADRRNAIRRNHSAAHLLHAALRSVLGNHVEQAGSYVDDHRVRFDFSHFQAMTADELAKVERMVNECILSGMTVETVETDINTAKSMGAIALFGEKYGSKVRVIKMGDISAELCGGTHLDNTAKAGLFRLLSETSVAAGVRRIEGTTGLGVLSVIDEREALLDEIAHELKSNVADSPKRAASLNNELKAAKREIDSLNSRLAASRTAGLLADARDIDGIKLITEATETAPDVLRALCDDLKAKDENVVAVFSAVNEGRLNFVGACGKNAVARGAHAGNILKQVSAITGGKGGGRPDSAASGGRDIDKIPEALAAVPGILSEMLK